MSVSTSRAAKTLAHQRAKKLSPSKRRAIAAKAAKARWHWKGRRTMSLGPNTLYDYDM